MGDKATIKVWRKPCFFSGARKFDVFMDENRLGDIANGKEQCFDVASGKHSMFIKRGRQSEAIEFDLTPNGSIEYECGVSPQYFRWFSFLTPVQTFTVIVLLLVAILRANGWILGIGCAVIIIGSIWLDKFLSKPGRIYYLKKRDG